MQLIILKNLKQIMVNQFLCYKGRFMSLQETGFGGVKTTELQSNLLNFGNSLLII